VAREPPAALYGDGLLGLGHDKVDRLQLGALCGRQGEEEECAEHDVVINSDDSATTGRTDVVCARYGLVSQPQACACGLVPKAGATPKQAP